MKTVRVYGALARFLGRRTFRAEVSSAAEAVQFLLANWPALQAHMAQQRYRVTLGAESIGADDLHRPAGAAEIALIPIIGGSGAVIRVITGVALIALSFIPGIAPVAVALMTGVGASLALGGVAQLLTPVPQISGPGAGISGALSPLAMDRRSVDDPRRNYGFSGIQNTVRAGVPVPVVYGRCYVGSVVISQAIDVDQVQA